MKNAVGRDIPDYLLTNGKEVYQGKNYMDGKYIQKAAPKTRRYEKPQESKIVATIADALRQCGCKDGCTFSFHHHLRNGDYVANMVVKAAVEELGVKDIVVAATSLGSAHDVIADYIEKGIVVGIQTSGIRDRIGDVVSAGKLKTPAIIRSHGGRPRAIEAGEVHIDIAVVAAPTSDCVGNCRGIGGKSNCGSMGYAMMDAKYADYVIVVTDDLVDFPNMPASVEAIDVDAVVVVDSIGDPKKIASAAARISENPRDLMMAENVAKVIASTPYFKDGFSFQTGVGGPSLAANLFLEKYMDERNIKMGWAIGGICGPMVELLKKGKVGKVIDVQDFDLDAVNSINQTPNHFEMSASQYANPANKGAFVNKLDFVVLAALEIDTDFNVNVLTGSDGVLRGAPGGHPDTAAGSKCCVIVTPLTRGRMATVCEHVVTVTTPGDCVDVLVTDYGIAVNPLRPDLIECLDNAGIPHVSIESLKEKAYSLVGRPDDLQWEDKVVAILEARDGTILDVVRKIKPYTVDQE
ncbi:MAG: citrate lyase subunit alpha [Oscillospiraceae bacterium]|nr:citrate lyase subunit alpha [Oscillospiraceae bacterium]